MSEQTPFTKEWEKTQMRLPKRELLENYVKACKANIALQEIVRNPALLKRMKVK